MVQEISQDSIETFIALGQNIVMKKQKIKSACGLNEVVKMDERPTKDT